MKNISELKSKDATHRDIGSAIFFFTGTHEDYHRATDHVDKIDLDKITRITRLIFYYANEIANDTNKPQWDPAGLEVFRSSTGAWELREPLDTTWLWTDGLRELVDSIQEGRPPLGPPEVDLHLLDIVAAVGRAAVTGREQGVASQPAIPDLTYDPPRGHAHDRTRPIGQQ